MCISIRIYRETRCGGVGCAGGEGAARVNTKTLNTKNTKRTEWLEALRINGKEMIVEYGNALVFTNRGA